MKVLIKCDENEFHQWRWTLTPVGEGEILKSEYIFLKRRPATTEAQKISKKRKLTIVNLSEWVRDR